jgi:hypothetical protein
MRAAADAQPMRRRARPSLRRVPSPSRLRLIGCPVRHQAVEILAIIRKPEAERWLAEKGEPE